MGSPNAVHATVSRINFLLIPTIYIYNIHIVFDRPKLESFFLPIHFLIPHPNGMSLLFQTHLAICWVELNAPSPTSK